MWHGSAKWPTWYGPRWRHGAFEGGKEQPEHYVWRSMLARCSNPNQQSYYAYGGRGIKVCKRWRTYQNFLADMGKRPTPKHTLERINNKGNYIPSNCKWALRSEQQKNKRTTRRWKCKGEIGTLVEWAARLGISKQLAMWRMKQWGTFERGREWQLQRVALK